MKNFFKYAMMIVAVVMSVVVISSCSKDDDNSTNNNTTTDSKSLLVGTWNANIDSRDNNATLTFKSDGSFSYYNPRDIENYDNCTGKASGLWVLSDNILVMTLKENHSQYIDEVFTCTKKVLTLNSTTFSYMDISDGSTYILTRK